MAKKKKREDNIVQFFSFESTAYSGNGEEKCICCFGVPIASSRFFGAHLSQGTFNVSITWHLDRPRCFIFACFFFFY